MVDQVDQATGIAEQHAQRFIDRARAAAALPDPVRGDCEACCEEDVMVRGCAGLMRCVDCRTKWEKRK